MSNRDVAAARRYHDATKHSVARLQAHPHYLDWDIKPMPFKVYPHIAPIPLSRELTPSHVPALRAIAGREAPADEPCMPELTALARVLYFSAGITRKKVYPGGEEYYFRAAACTGALYHIDLYVICAALPALAAGVYHFGPHNFALHQLRAGDHRGVLVAATGAEDSVQHAPIIIACASTYWRNSWKYQARAYRHCFWDSGTLLANLLAVAAADAVPARVICGFVDDMVSALLGLDAQREAPLALATLGYDPHAITAPQLPPAAISFETLPLSAREVDYPAIREMQAASSLQTPGEVSEWRSNAPAAEEGKGVGETFPLAPLAELNLPRETIDSVIQRRGSTRRFAQTPIGFAQLSTILERATRGLPSDWGVSPNNVYLIVNAVDGLPAGAYAYDRQHEALQLLRRGAFRSAAGHLGLGQALPADASVNIYLLCDLDAVLARFGNRGYRVAQLDAAIVGGKIYLAAYGLRLGATGLTFFDDEVTDFFAPHAAGKSVMFLVALGKSRASVA